jgi:hypothetical protein
VRKRVRDEMHATPPAEQVPTLPVAAQSFEERWARFRASGPQDVCSIYEVEERFRRWLYLPDAGIIHVTLGAIAANLLPGPPIWLMLVGPPSSGKTEPVMACSKLPGVHFAATLIEAALLSGSPKRERAADATGGLLRAIGDFGIVVCKDFGSVLSMNRDTRAATIAALSEVFDGSWTRLIGTDGGRTLSWTGKVGFLGCVTPAIDSAHAVLSAMGERFIYYRLPAADPELQALRAIQNTGHYVEMGRDLADAVSGLFRAVKLEGIEITTMEAASRFVSLAALVAQARSSVERDGRTREVELVPEAEMPARVAQELIALDDGMRIIGTKPEERWQLVCKVAFDSLPALRRRLRFAAIQSETHCTTADFALLVGHPTSTARRALEDLAAHSILRRLKLTSNSDAWEVTEKTRERWSMASVQIAEMSEDPQESFPEMSGGL